MTETNRNRLRPLESPETLNAFLNLPARMVQEAKAVRMPPKRAALLVQTAVAIEILIFAPMRLGNLSKIDLERHVVRIGPDRDRIHIVIGAREVKNKIDLDYPLPQEVASLIDYYVEKHRPLLATAESAALFPGRLGQPKSMGMLRSQISFNIFRYTGLKMHPHLFRHIAAKLALDANPGSHSAVSRMLAQKSSQTAYNHYTGMETSAALRHFAGIVDGLRQRRKERQVQKPKNSKKQPRGRKSTTSRKGRA